MRCCKFKEEGTVSDTCNVTKRLTYEHVISVRRGERSERKARFKKGGGPITKEEEKYSRWQEQDILKLQNSDNRKLGFMYSLRS
jgi:hypothetical protein